MIIPKDYVIGATYKLNMGTVSPNLEEKMYNCIGKRRDSKGQLILCDSTSENPSVASRPEFGFLCFGCAGSPPISRPLLVDLPDRDHPNQTEFEPCEEYHRSRTSVRATDESDDLESFG